MNVSNEFSYRVSVKKADNWQRYNRARLGISVGKPQHEGAKFEAALDWAAKRFEHVDVRVSDTLQRYNFPGNPEENWDVSRAAGSAWIERHHYILSKYPRIHLFRWDDVRTHPDMPEHVKFVQDKLNDPVFKSAFDLDIATHVERTGKDPDRCRAFALEELAVFNLLQEKRPAADVYPGTFLTCRRFMRDDFSLVRIDFDRAWKNLELSLGKVA